MTSFLNNAAPIDDSLSSRVCIEDHFVSNADVLREQVERRLTEASAVCRGITPLKAAFCVGGYQFLTASAACFLGECELDMLVKSLYSWAVTRLQLDHVSSPQLRLLDRGSWRSVMKDDIPADWHYVLCLDPPRLRTSLRLQVLEDGTSWTWRPDLPRVTTYKLIFNRLIVHRVDCAYGIAAKRHSSGLLDANMFIDGYFW
jgi:hypothetical protein